MGAQDRDIAQAKGFIAPPVYWRHRPETTLVYHAAVRGIEIRALEAQVDGDLDLRGFLGMSDELRRGFEGIRVSYRVDTDPQNLETLRELMTLSPVLDITRNGTNVDVSITQMQP